MTSTWVLLRELDEALGELRGALAQLADAIPVERRLRKGWREEVLVALETAEIMLQTADKATAELLGPWNKE